MSVKWSNSESTVRPDEVDAQSSPTTVYLHKDIREVVREDIEGKVITMYEYLEATLTPVEYQAYVAEKQRSDIDYIAMMSDIDLEEE